MATPALSVTEHGRSGHHPHLSHRRSAFWLDFIDHPYLAWLPVRVLIHAPIFFGQAIDMSIGPLFGDFDHTAPYLQIAIGVVRILDRQSYPWIAPHITILHSSLCRVDPDVR